MAIDMAQYWMSVASYRLNHRQQREGQILFNVFSMMNPEMSNFVCGKEFDPFYDDERIPLFIEFISSL